jgi:predicted hydrocarbon binding protein
VKWIERTHGPGRLDDVLGGCSEGTRAVVESARTERWVPVGAMIDLAESADRVVGRHDGKVAEQIGESHARAITRGPFRVVARVANASFLMRRAARVWRQQHDAGAIELLEADDHACELEVQGVPDPQWIFCALLTGWTREVARASSHVDAIVKHTQCRANGATRCLWHVVWSAPVGHEMFVPSFVGAKK